MLVLGLDFETTGIDTKTARVVEIGAVLWDTAFNMPMKIYSEFVYDSSYSDADIKNSGDESHGIPLDALKKFGVEPRTAFRELLTMIGKASYVVGHNVRGYDAEILREELSRLGIDWPSFRIIDTMTDVPFPKNFKARNLDYLAAKHGFVNPFPHRAMTDVLSTLKIFAGYPLFEVEKYANAPLVTIRAKVSFDDKQKAKDRKYQWDGEKKWWLKQIKDFQLEEEQKADFPVVVVGAKA